MSQDTGLTTELSAADTLALLQSQSRGKHADDQALSVVTKVGDWLPYIQLMGSNNKEVKRGQFPIGHFALVENKKNIDIGNSFVAYLLSWRPKAMQFAPTVVSFFDTKSEGFQKIQAKADQKDSNCGFGPEFLVWLPEQKKLATFFLGNKTGRNEAPNFISCLEKEVRKCRVISDLIEDKRQNREWHGAKIMPYDLEIAVFPPREELLHWLEKFNNPKDSEAGPAEAAEGDGDRG
jgi:hypothetical protein